MKLKPLILIPIIGILIYLFLNRKTITQKLSTPSNTPETVKSKALSELVGVGISALTNMVNYGIKAFTSDTTTPSFKTTDIYTPIPVDIGDYNFSNLNTAFGLSDTSGEVGWW